MSLEKKNVLAHICSWKIFFVLKILNRCGRKRKGKNFFLYICFDLLRELFFFCFFFVLRDETSETKHGNPSCSYVNPDTLRSVIFLIEGTVFMKVGRMAANPKKKYIIYIPSDNKQKKRLFLVKRTRNVKRERERESKTIYD